MSGVQFTEALNFTVTDDTATEIGLNGYKLVLQSAYTGLSGYEFVDATGPSITVNAMRESDAAQDWLFSASQAMRGFASGLDIAPEDFNLRFVNNNGSDYTVTLNSSITVAVSPQFMLANSTTVETPNNLAVGSTVNAFIATTSGKKITDVIQIDVIPEPSSTALLGLGSLSLLMRRRRA